MATLTLDRERRVQYTWAALKRLKREQGLNFLELVTGETEWYLDPEIFSAVLWAGLVTDDPDLTVDQVDGLIALPKLNVITTAMLQAVQEALQEGEQGVNPPTRWRGSSGRPTSMGYAGGKLIG